MLKIFCLAVMGLLMICSLAAAALVDNRDGTVTDTATGLMWQQAEGGFMPWEAALTYCENLELAGYDDWRLPNRNELQSIVDYEKQPAVDTIYFPGVLPSFAYWSSTTSAGDTSEAWIVHFGDGNVYGFPKLDDHYVRAVRAGQCTAPQIAAPTPANPKSINSPVRSFKLGVALLR